jgi:type IV pilus assembly protein PilN
MAHINLLPWRAALKKEREQRFAAFTGIGVAITAAILLLVHLYYAGRIEYQQSRNEFLKQQIAEADKKIAEIKDLETERERLYARMKVIQQLQISRPDAVHLMDELAKTLPEGVYYKSIKQTATKIVFSGVAQSQARVSTLMRELENSEWLMTPLLKIIEAKEVKGKTNKVQEFILEVSQQPRKKPEEEENAGGKSTKKPGTAGE